MDATALSSLAAPERVAMQTGDWQVVQSDAHGKGQGGGLSADANLGTYVVTFNPKRSNLLHFGAHTLEIPAGAVCAARSGYGFAVFDKKCRSEKDDVTITAIVSSVEGGIPRIDLMPAMRFNPKDTVTLTLRVPDISAASSTSSILYCPTQSADACIDEAALDPSLATHVDRRASTLFRRIKHFSGYFIEM